MIREIIESRSHPIPWSGCWIWMGGVGSHGYGVLYTGKVGGQKLRHIGAHVASYQEFKGPVPNGMYVCHKCDVRTCVNPDHLFAGTAKENARDMVAKGRNISKPRQGENHHRAKVTKAQVDEIRKCVARGGRSFKEIGKMYGLSGTQVGNIHHMRVWQW